jgi:hypothetical protein
VWLRRRESVSNKIKLLVAEGVPLVDG